MILMMSFVGWKCGDFPVEWRARLPPLASLARFTLPPTGDGRFRDAPWQQIVRLGLVPVIIGLVIASGTVTAHAADTSWRAVAVTIAAAAIALATRLSPMWMLVIGGALGGLGVL
jgi:hypothetical protein